MNHLKKERNHQNRNLIRDLRLNEEDVESPLRTEIKNEEGGGVKEITLNSRRKMNGGMRIPPIINISRLPLDTTAPLHISVRIV